MYKSDTVQDIISNQPIMLMRNGEIIEENMKKCKVTNAELRAKLREANVLRLSQARAVIFETTGDVSVLHADHNSNIEIEDFILEGVMR